MKITQNLYHLHTSGKKIVKRISLVERLTAHMNNKANDHLAKLLLSMEKAEYEKCKETMKK